MFPIIFSGFVFNAFIYSHVLFVYQHEIEPPQNQKSRELSASALKNKKKREAKARSKKEKEVC